MFTLSITLMQLNCHDPLENKFVTHRKAFGMSPKQKIVKKRSVLFTFTYDFPEVLLFACIHKILVGYMRLSSEDYWIKYCVFS